MWGDAGRKAKSWLGLTVMTVAGVLAPDMQAQANEYSSVAVGDPRLPVTEVTMLPRGIFDTRNYLGIDNNRGNGILLIP